MTLFRTNALRYRRLPCRALRRATPGQSWRAAGHCCGVLLNSSWSSLVRQRVAPGGWVPRCSADLAQALFAVPGPRRGSPPAAFMAAGLQ